MAVEEALAVRAGGGRGEEEGKKEDVRGHREGGR